MTTYPPSSDVGETLITEDQIAKRVAELGAEITADFAGKSPLVISVLKGSAIFVADLVRAIELPVTMDFLVVSSYGKATESSGVVKIIKDLDEDVSGRDVLIVDDIIDSGLTLKYLLEYVDGQGPASLKSCTLLLRGERATVASADYVGFTTASDAFVVGYGLDAGQMYRNLSYIAEFTAG